MRSATALQHDWDAACSAILRLHAEALDFMGHAACQTKLDLLLVLAGCVAASQCICQEHSTGNSQVSAEQAKPGCCRTWQSRS